MTFAYKISATNLVVDYKLMAEILATFLIERFLISVIFSGF